MFFFYVPDLAKTRERYREKKNNIVSIHNIFTHIHDNSKSQYKKKKECHSNFYDSSFINHNFFLLLQNRLGHIFIAFVCCVIVYLVFSSPLFDFLCLFLWNNSNKLNHFFDFRPYNSCVLWIVQNSMLYVAYFIFHRIFRTEWHLLRPIVDKI